MFPYFGMFDSTYLLVIIGIIISIWAQIRVNSIFNKYSNFSNSKGYTGADVARYILNENGLYDVAIERIEGQLTDHFDPKTNVIRLSDSTYNSTSVSAIGVAAHETGHAIQHATGYVPIRLRNSIVPVANIGSTLSFPILLIGIFLGMYNLINVGIILFSLVLVFQIVTLPVEFNASSRAVLALENGYLLNETETKQAKKVLSAAAMTYVAAAAVTALQLLRLFLLFGGRSNDD